MFNPGYAEFRASISIEAVNLTRFLVWTCGVGGCVVGSGLRGVVEPLSGSVGMVVLLFNEAVNCGLE